MIAVSTGLAGEALEFVWDFGDGTKDIGESLKHSYDREGEYTITLTITNEFTETFTDTLLSQPCFMKLKQ